jgi:hypothetical protein
MTTNPLRADALRKQIAQAIHNEHSAPIDWGECKKIADAILALLTPPPSLASVVAEIDDLIERNNLAMHRDGSVSGLFMGSLAWKLFNNWPQLRTALTISGNGWRDIESMPTNGDDFLAEFQFSDREKPEIVQVRRWSRDPEGSVVFTPFVGKGKSRPCIRFYPKRWQPLPQPKTGDA